MEIGEPIEDLERFTEGTHRKLFRGLGDYDYRLLPSISRVFKGGDLLGLVRRENVMLSLFRRYAAPHTAGHNYTPFEWLAIAQHHGMRTRLMDWTRNPLVALFFAVRSNTGKNAAIITVDTQGEKMNSKDEDPFNPTGNFWFWPSHVTARITAQQCLFSTQVNPLVEFEHPSLRKHLVRAEDCHRYRLLLNKWGINEATLFPDLEGITAMLNRNLEVKELFEREEPQGGSPP